MRVFSLKVLLLTLVAAVALPVSHAASSPKRTPDSEAKKKVVQARGAKAKREPRETREAREHRRRQMALEGGGVQKSGAKRRGTYQKVAFASALAGVPPVLTAGDLAGLNLTPNPLALSSNVALVMDQTTNEVLFEKNATIPLPIASITKLMTSLVVVEAGQDLDELLTVTEEDVDREKFTHSRLRVGAQLSRANMLHIALMSSENRAAAALGRNYPGGIRAFVAAMNTCARELGMDSSQFSDSTGLNSSNVSSAREKK